LGSEDSPPVGVPEAPRVFTAAWETVLVWLLRLYAAPFAVLMSARGEKGLLAVALLNIPFQIGGPLWQDEAISDLGSPGSPTLTLTTLALCGLYAGWFLRATIDKAAHPQTRWRFSLPLTIYFVVITLSASVAQRPALSFVELYLSGQMFLLFLYVANWTRTHNDVLFIVVFLLIGLTLNGAAAVVLNHVGHTIHVTGFFAQVTEGDLSVHRVGLPGSPNLAASYVATVLSLALGVLLTNLRGSVRKLACAAVLSGAVHLVLTLSRGGWLEFLTSCMIIWFFSLRRGWTSVKLPLIVFILSVIVCVLLYGHIEARLGSDEAADSADARLPLNEIAFRMISDHPILGVGVNNFPVRLSDYVNTYNVGDYLVTVHNNYLLIWSETGICGLVAYLWFLVAIVRQAWRCFRCGDRFVAPIALGFLGAVVGLMLHMMVDKFVENMDAFWVFAGLMVAMQDMTTAAGWASRDSRIPDQELVQPRPFAPRWSFCGRGLHEASN
jgi:O-antigen ligase